jgi:hypothetical protein
MIVEDFDGTNVVNEVAELESLLERRPVEDAGAFWLSNEGGAFPTLSILIKDGWAILHYIPAANEAGLRSLGDKCGGELLRFSISRNPADDVEEPSDAIVPREAAIKAAREFFLGGIPTSVKWIEL